MCVHHSDAFSDKHAAQQWETVETSGGSGLIVHHLQGEVVDLQAIGQVPDPLPRAIGMGGDNHLVSLFNQALGEMVNVTFYSPHVWIEEVRDHADVVFPTTDPDSIGRSSRDSPR